MSKADNTIAGMRLWPGERLDFVLATPWERNTSVHWRLSQRENGEWCFVDSGHLKSFRYRDRAIAYAEEMNAAHGREEADEA